MLRSVFLEVILGERDAAVIPQDELKALVMTKGAPVIFTLKKHFYTFFFTENYMFRHFRRIATYF